MHEPLAKVKETTQTRALRQEMERLSENDLDTLLQDHYTFEGSVSERIKAVVRAANQWRRLDENREYRWYQVTAVYDEFVVLSDYNWETECYAYIAVDYSVSDNTEVTILGNVREADANIVITFKSSDDSQAAPIATTEEEETPVVEAKPEEQAEPVVPIEEPAVEVPAPTEEQATEEQPTEELIQSSAYDQNNVVMSQILSQTVSEDGKLMKIKGIATRAEIINAAGIVYQRAIWLDNVDRMDQEAKAGKFLGKVEHPDQEQGLVDAAIKFDAFWMEGDDLMFEATIIPTEHGQNLRAMIEAGVSIDMSTRGYGVVKQGDWRGQKVKLIQKGFKCTAVDAVWHGASFGSGVTEAYVQSAAPEDAAPTPTPEEEKPTEQSAPGTDTHAKDTNVDEPITQTAEERAEALNQSALLDKTKANLIAQSKLDEKGLKAYQAALDKATTLDELFAQSDAALPALQEVFTKVEDAPEEVTTQSQVYTPTFFVKQDASETAPKTANEMIDRLVRDIPASTRIQGVPHHLTCKRESTRKWLQNIAQIEVQGFNGPRAMAGLIQLEQGRKPEDVQNFLDQDLTQAMPAFAVTAGGNSDPGGAPISAPFIFLLVRRTAMRLFLHEIGTIQPMDRPDGKIFYLDGLRYDDPHSSGLTKRVDINTSANPLNSSWATNNTEGLEAKGVKLVLASKSVEAESKKIGLGWTVEEMQDLRAYHNLDASGELMDIGAQEMAQEYNLEFLTMLLSEATGGDLTYGQVKPADGYPNQSDWDAYIWTYISALDNEIFANRNGKATHLVVGMDAALALAKNFRMTFEIGGENGGDMNDQYPGTEYLGTITGQSGSRLKVFKTNFWRSGSDEGKKILVIRNAGTTKFGDTPAIFAPYATYVTPEFTHPTEFHTSKGIMSRAAMEMVNPEAVAVLTIDPNLTGAHL